MIPLVKTRLNLNDAELGSLLLLLGAGSVSMMPATGMLPVRAGSRTIILILAIVISVRPVPVFLTEAGKLKGVSSAMAGSVIAIFGYGGQLAGPAILGFIARRF